MSVSTNLTPREHQILLMICDNQKEVFIASSLGINKSTVSKHTEAIYQKLGANNRLSCYIQALSRELISPPSVNVAIRVNI